MSAQPDCEAPQMIRVPVAQATPDDHVFIVIKCPGRPPISIDIQNLHGRRGVSLRVDGMGIFYALVDLKELQPKGEAMFRYCPMCGEPIKLHSSRSHECAAEEIANG